MLCSARSALLCLAVLGPNPALEAGELHGPYEADTMQLFFSWQRMELNITAVAPANNIVGFERIPETAKEKRDLRLKDKLIFENPLISEQAQANCTPQKVDVYTELYTAHTHENDLFTSIFGEDDSDTVDHSVGENGRVDYQLEISYRCRKKQALPLRVFDHFPTIKQVRVRTGGIYGKVKQVITPDNPILLPH